MVKMQGNELIRFDFHKDDRAFNPLKALYILADHFVIAGESISMTSERLLGGRSVYYVFGSRARRHMVSLCPEADDKGTIAPFPGNGSLVSKCFAPIESSAMIAESLVTQFEEHRQSHSIETLSSPGPSLVERQVREILDLLQNYWASASSIL